MGLSKSWGYKGKPHQPKSNRFGLDVQQFVLHDDAMFGEEGEIRI